MPLAMDQPNLELFCLVLDDSSRRVGDIFLIRISPNAFIDDLKELIFKKAPIDIASCRNSSHLTLYQLNPPLHTEALEACSGPLHANRSETRLNPAKKIQEYFKGEQVENSIHILVRLPFAHVEAASKHIFDFAAASAVVADAPEALIRRRVMLPKSVTIYQIVSEAQGTLQPLLPQGGFRSDLGIVAVDKTKYIELLDTQPSWSYMFLRPAHWGKSTFLATLMDYYDKRNEHRFDDMFGGLYIGLKPTTSRTSLLVLPFNFSCLYWSDYDQFDTQFNSYLNSVIKDFLVNNFKFLEPFDGQDILIEENGTMSLLNLIRLVQRRHQNLFVGVDNYDSPATDLLFDPETKCTSYSLFAMFFKARFYNAIEEGIRITVITKYWITGVLPVFRDFINTPLLSDLPGFHGICGLDDSEVQKITTVFLSHFRHESQEIEMAINDLHRWYNGYRFCDFSNSDCSVNTLYNPELVFTHLQELASKQTRIKPPNEICAVHTSRLLNAIPNEGDSSFFQFFHTTQSCRLKAGLAPFIGLAEARLQGEDWSVTQTLLYYSGGLSYAGSGKYFIIPNATITNAFYCHFSLCLATFNKGEHLRQAQLAYTALTRKCPSLLVHVVEGFWDCQPIHALLQSNKTLRVTLEVLWYEVASSCISELRLQMDHPRHRFSFVDLVIGASLSFPCFDLRNITLDQLCQGEHHTQPYDLEVAYIKLRKCLKHESEDTLLARSLTFWNSTTNQRENRTVESLKQEAIVRVKEHIKVMKNGAAQAGCHGILDSRVKCWLGIAELIGYVVIGLGATRILVYQVETEKVSYCYELTE